MLAPGRIEVERGGIGHVAAAVVGHYRNIIAYLLLHRPPFVRIKRIADRDISRPCHAAIRAVRIE
jgi:hypothetical protein